MNAASPFATSVRAASAGDIAPARGSDMAPEATEMIALVVMSLLDLAFYLTGAYPLLNLAGPVMLGVAMGWGIWRLVRRTPAGVWTPLFALRAGITVWLAIGSLVPLFEGEAGAMWIDAYYSYTPQEGAKVNLLFALGTLITIASIKLCSLVKPQIRRKESASVLSERGSLLLGVLFAGLGQGYGFLIQLPVVLGVLPDIIPGAVALLFQALGAVGIFLITLWATRKGGAAYAPVVGLILMSLAFSLVMLEKSSFILAILLAGVAVLLSKVTIVRLSAVVAALALALTFITPPVTQARILHYQAYADPGGGTLEERIDYYVDYYQGFRLPSAQQDVSSFMRLHYTPYVAFVLAQYDDGLPSERISTGLYAIIPRVIWPDKPLVSDIGTELNYLITGYDTSALGATLFGDLYWNFGWTGLLLLIPTGAFLWWASLVARNIVEMRDWIMMPFVLFVFQIGISVDNNFILRWLTPAIMSIVLLGGLRMASQMVFRIARPSMASSGRISGAP